MNIEKISCVGTGVIGASWATNFIIKGCYVNLYDVGEEELDRAISLVDNNLGFLVKKEVLTVEEKDYAKSLMKTTTSLEEAVKDVHLIQESVPEKYEIKQEILKEADSFAPEEAIFASSTSGLLISEIAKYSNNPFRCIGAHPYNPPHLIPLVEITKGEKSSQETIDRAYDFYKSIDKEPIVLQKEVLGFVANRLSLALYREAIELIMRGVCSVEDVDKAVTFGPGLRYATMGPSLLYHLGGGAHGIKGILHHIGPSVEKWWEDMATFTKIPDGFPEIAQEGVKEELKNRSKEFGNTEEEVIKFRDDILIELLKNHKKV
ncbi:3-hydroxyacyl-CoA dehydrogenase family protein [Natranaerofaba carboxydovora]|uniref:3-hydroxyacyl-CoA dehydrogenase family protein n=1 Tax=Natranaerofaba carboxydovora TaxID=2742683 RepID=UPI001F12C4DC|nr:3-hydroxyacyl-CoA dehydrogenase family protein [Natranaerofaba carboxydovora]UMZ74226.1 L-carnitine dehydrogenase [Natranaerofaba carboxydovora]